jgi:hypothetical protein
MSGFPQRHAGHALKGVVSFSLCRRFEDRAAQGYDSSTEPPGDWRSLNLIFCEQVSTHYPCRIKKPH